MLGPGKYDDLCTEARTKANATGALLIIVGGDKGPGFSAQLTAEHLSGLPNLLRNLANQIEKDAKNGIY